MLYIVEVKQKMQGPKQDALKSNSATGNSITDDKNGKLIEEIFSLLDQDAVNKYAREPFLDLFVVLSAEAIRKKDREKVKLILERFESLLENAKSEYMQAYIASQIVLLSFLTESKKEYQKQLDNWRINFLYHYLFDSGREGKDYDNEGTNGNRHEGDDYGFGMKRKEPMIKMALSN